MFLDFIKQLKDRPRYGFCIYDVKTREKIYLYLIIGSLDIVFYFESKKLIDIINVNQKTH